MSKHHDSNTFFWGVILIIIGALFLLDNFDIMDFGYFIRTFWPIVLIIFGIKIILTKRKASDMKDDRDYSGESRINGDRLSENNVFGDIKVNVESKKFTGGSVNNVFGDIRLDLSRAEIEPGISKLYVSGVFGDIMIYTPRNVALSIKSSAVGGDISIFGKKREGLFPTLNHREDGYESAEKRIYIQSSIVFGSIGIFYPDEV